MTSSDCNEMMENYNLHADVDIWDTTISDLCSVPSCVILQAIRRMKDEEICARTMTKKRLMEFYHTYCSTLRDRDYCCQFIEHFEMIPSTLIASALNDESEDLRLLNVELFMVEDMFPNSISMLDKTYHWIKLFSYFSSYQRNILVSILLEKKRLQKEMKDYMKLREEEKKNFSKDVQDKISSSFLRMKTFFPDSLEALKCFQMLHQCNDNQLFSYMSELLSKDTASDLPQLYQEKLLSRIDKNDPLYGFVRILLIKCSYSIFSYDHVENILMVLSIRIIEKLDGDEFTDMSTFDLPSCIDLLSVILEWCPKILKFVREGFLELFSVATGSSTVRLLQMISRLGHHIPIPLSAICPLLKEIQYKGCYAESYYAVAAMKSLGVCSDLDSSKMDIPQLEVCVQNIHSEATSEAPMKKRKSNQAWRDASSKRTERSGLLAFRG